MRKHLVSRSKKIADCLYLAEDAWLAEVRLSPDRLANRKTQVFGRTGTCWGRRRLTLSLSLSQAVERMLLLQPTCSVLSIGGARPARGSRGLLFGVRALTVMYLSSSYVAGPQADPALTSSQSPRSRTTSAATASKEKRRIVKGARVLTSLRPPARVCGARERERKRERERETLFAGHRRPSARVDCAVLDYESGWRSAVRELACAYARTAQPTRTTPPLATASFDGALDRRHACSFDGADVTLPLRHFSNAAALARAPTADCLVFSYVLAENKLALRDSDWVFLRDLLAAAKPGAVFLLAETTHRLWPEILRVASEAFEHRQFPVSIPTELSLCGGGSVFVFAKPRPRANELVSGAPPEAPTSNNGSDDDAPLAWLSPQHAAQISRFEQDNANHERRLLNRPLPVVLV